MLVFKPVRTDRKEQPEAAV